jgi:hypothetical protein
MIGNAGRWVPEGRSDDCSVAQIYQQARHVLRVRYSERLCERHTGQEAVWSPGVATGEASEEFAPQSSQKLELDCPLWV